MRSNFQEISLSSFFFKLRFLRDIFFLRILHLFLPRLGGFSSKPSLLSLLHSLFESIFAFFPLLFRIFPFLSSFSLSFLTLNLIASIFDFSSFLHYLQNSQPNVVFALSSKSSYFMLVLPCRGTKLS